MIKKFCRKFYTMLHYVKIAFWARKYKYMMKCGKNLQVEYLVNMLQYAQKHSKYYSRLLQDVHIRPDNCYSILSSLPFLSKSVIREQGANLYSDAFPLDKITWVNTGGSTGEPLHFPSAVKLGLEEIHQYMLYKAMGWKFGERIVSIDGSRVPDAQLSQNIYWVKGTNFPYGLYSYSTLYMSEEKLKYYIDSFNKVKPVILRGYPSGFMEICNFIVKYNNKLSFKPKGIYLTSETLSESDRKYVSKIFDCPVYGQYGHTEASVFAVTDEDSLVYRCSPFYGVVEVVDEDGNPVKEGCCGEIVVTGFSNLATPFIRYKTGDLAVYGGSKDGCVILTSLLGRTVDYIWNADNEKIYLVGFIFGAHLPAFNFIEDWQIEQKVVGKITIRIVKATGYTTRVEEELLNFFVEKKIFPELFYLSNISKSQRGKKIFLIQHVK